jgi:hypothetical protein
MKLVTIWFQDQWKTALLVSEGTKYNHFVALIGTIKSTKVRKIRLLVSDGYSHVKEVRTVDYAISYLNLGMKHDITLGALKALGVEDVESTE